MGSSHQHPPAGSTDPRPSFTRLIESLGQQNVDEVGQGEAWATCPCVHDQSQFYPRASLDRVVDALRQAGSKITGGGNQYKVTCVAHDDANPSLSVSYLPGEQRTELHCFAGCDRDTILDALGMARRDLRDFARLHSTHRDDRTLIYCAAGCSTDAILTQIGLTRSDLYDSTHRRRGDGESARNADGTEAAQPVPRKTRPPRLGALPKRLTKPPKPKRTSLQKETAAWDYITLDGEVVGQNVRYEWEERDSAGITRRSKSFRQRHPDGAGAWVSGGPEVDHVPLYRWPEVAAALAAGGAVVWRTEGEKDADNGAEVVGDQAVTTTNLGGAGSFTDRQGADLAGAAQVNDVVDHDLAGYKRGLAGYTQVAPHVGQFRVFLPRVTHHGADLSDHLAAGYSLDQLEEVSKGRLEALVIRHTVAERCELYGYVLDEIRAQQEAAEQCRGRDAVKAAEQHDRNAARWAHQAGMILVRVTPMLAEVEQTRELDQIRPVREMIIHAEEITRQAYELTGAEPRDDAADVLAPRPVDAPGQGGGDGGADIARHPSSDDPGHGFVMLYSVARGGTWFYHPGGDGRERGVYYQPTDRAREIVAPLPYVHARIQRKDGAGRLIDHVFLVSANEDDPPVLLTYRQIKDGSWANLLGLVLSLDDKIMKQAGTALISVAQTAPMRDPLPRLGPDGKISVPTPETLPSGYLEIAESSTWEQSREIWGELIPLLTIAPKMAWAWAASAIAPFVGTLPSDRAQSHVFNMFSLARNGKGTTERVCAAIWGDNRTKGRVIRPFNTTANAVYGRLGPLALLPAFYDESTSAEIDSWGRFITNVTEGASKDRADRDGLGTRSSGLWHGIFFVAGNASLLEERREHSGRFDGVPARIISVDGTMTLNAHHGEQISALLDQPELDAHLGRLILETTTVDTVRELIQHAVARLATPEDGRQRRTVAKHLQLHIAGAMLLDQIFGTGSTITDAVTTATTDYLDGFADPIDDGTRMEQMLREDRAAEVAMWPTEETYRALTTPFTADGPQMPRSGVNKTLNGIQLNDGSIAVFPRYWRELCAEANLDSKTTPRLLHERGVLIVSQAQRRAGEWTTKIAAAKTQMFKLRLPEESGGDDEPATPSGPGDDQALLIPDPSPDSGSGSGSIPGDIPGAKPSLTRGIPGIPGTNPVVTHTGARNPSDPPAAEAGNTDKGSTMHSRAAAYTAGTTRSWTDAEFGVAISRALAEEDTAALDKLEQLMDQRFDQAGPAPSAPAAVEEPPAKPAPEPQRAPAAPAVPPARSAPLVACPPWSKRPLERFTAPAAVLDADQAHRGGHPPVGWQPGHHLGDLAMLTRDDRLNLAWGGGALPPQDGQLWLTAEAMDRYGLPAVPDGMPDPDASREEQRSARLAAYAKLSGLPAVADALAAGWQLSRDQLDGWTRIWHPDRHPAGARLVFLPWLVSTVPLLSEDPSPAELATRLADFARLSGVAYEISPQTTVLKVLDHDRPPRRDPGDTSRKAAAPVRDETPELPPFLRRSDSRFAAIEGDYRWHRPWDSLLAEERRQRYVVFWDRHRSYAAPMQRLELGIRGLQHLTAEEARAAAEHLTRAELPAYLLVDKWENPVWWLPDPLAGTSGSVAAVEDGRVWVTTHTLRQLEKVDLHPTVHEVYTWAEHAPYFHGIYTRVTNAFKTPGVETPVLDTIKLFYQRVGGFVGQNEAPHRTEHLKRSDWRDMNIGAARTGILTTLINTRNVSGVLPLAVNTDTIIYATDNPDPWQSWPGSPKKVGPGTGQYEPEYVADLAEWGPEHLPATPRRFKLQTAVEAARRVPPRNTTAE